MAGSGLITEEERLVEIAVAMNLANCGERDLLVDHLKVCRDRLGMPVEHLSEMARNLSAAAGKDIAAAGRVMLSALEGFDNADAA